MTDRRFKLAEHLAETKPWTFFAMVEMGPDRMHHGFWKFMDPEHRKHEPGNQYENAILDYHRHVDGLIGGLLEHADEDTVVFVVSDHGAKRLDGGIRINEWLRREGLLATLAEPDGVSSLRDVGVDWPKTTAWGEGGYYARVFLNVAGPRAGRRDPAGRVRGRSRRPRAAYRGDPGRRRKPDPDQGLQARGALRRAAGRRARPHRRLRRPALALGRHDRRRRGHPDARERHRARTTPTTRRTVSTSSPARESKRVAARMRTCSTSRRRCSRSSASKSRTVCAGRACSRFSRLADQTEGQASS